MDTILKDIKNNGKALKLLIIRTRGNVISLHSLIMKLNTRKTVLEKDYRFDKVFNIFDEIDNSCNKLQLQLYDPKTATMIIRKNEMLEYLEIIRSRLIDMLSTPSLIKKIMLTIKVI